MLKGIDISKWQTSTPSLAGLSFVALRASIGTTKDTMYDTHFANCRKAGVVTMAYHYGLDASDVAIADQVAVFLAVAKDADFLWLDQEASGFSDVEAQSFIDGVRAAGRPCGLYHSASGFGGVNADAQWVADWRDSSEAEGYPNTADGSKEFPGWELWQYDGSGADNLDNDYLNPASPLAALLRLGYVPKPQLDAAQAQIKAQGDQIASLMADVAARDAEIAELNAKVDGLEAQLAAAPGIEKERIAVASANAEADRIRAI